MDDTVTLTRAEYEDLIDARDHARAMQDLASGASEKLTDADADAYLAAPTALAFWRAKRGLTQAELASKVGITSAHVAAIAKGRRGMSVDICAKLARALGVRMEDLVDDRG